MESFDQLLRRLEDQSELSVRHLPHRSRGHGERQLHRHPRGRHRLFAVAIRRQDPGREVRIYYITSFSYRAFAKKRKKHDRCRKDVEEIPGVARNYHALFSRD